MGKLKQWCVLTAVAIAAILAAGWFLVVSPKYGQASDLRAEALTQQQATSMQRGQLAVLKAQAAGLPAKQARLGVVEAKVPSDPNLPALLRALTNAADASGVELLSVAPGTQVSVAAAAPAPAAREEPAPAAAPTGAAATTTAPANGAGALNAIPITLSVFGGYYQVEQFVAALEDLPRAFRVSSLTVVPGANPVATGGAASAPTTDGRSLLSTINGQIFLAANRAPASAVSLPAVDATTSTAAPASSGK